MILCITIFETVSETQIAGYATSMTVIITMITFVSLTHFATLWIGATVSIYTARIFVQVSRSATRIPCSSFSSATQNYSVWHFLSTPVPSIWLSVHISPAIFTEYFCFLQFQSINFLFPFITPSVSFCICHFIFEEQSNHSLNLLSSLCFHSVIIIVLQFFGLNFCNVPKSLLIDQPTIAPAIVIHLAVIIVFSNSKFLLSSCGLSVPRFALFFRSLSSAVGSPQFIHEGSFVVSCSNELDSPSPLLISFEDIRYLWRFISPHWYFIDLSSYS